MILGARLPTPPCRLRLPTVRLILPLRASHCAAANRRWGPKPDSRAAANARLFDDLVGASKKQLRDGNTECLGGLEVDDEFDLGGLLDRQIGRLLAL